MSKEELMHLAVIIHHHPTLVCELLRHLLPEEQEYTMSVVRHLATGENEVIRVEKEATDSA